MKKKGITLIELIISIAIISILLTAVLTTFSTSAFIWGNSGVTLDSMDYSDAVIQKFKSDGIAKLSSITGGTNLERSTYIYFDEDFKNFRTNGFIPSDLNSNGFMQWVNSNPQITTAVSDDFTSCKNGASGRKYGAYLMIKKDSSSAGQVYYVKVSVWNLNNGEKSRSAREIYLGR